MKSLYLWIFLSCAFVSNAQYAYVIGAQGKIYSIDIHSGCNATYFTEFAGKNLTDIAVDASGKIYVCTIDSLFMMDPASPGTWIPLGKFSTVGMNGLVVGLDGNIYASGHALIRYEPLTGVFTHLGNFPGSVASAGDLIIYNNHMYMSAQDGKIYEVNINDPASSTTFYALGNESIFGMMIIPVKCFNDPVPTLRLLAFAPTTNSSSTAYMINMEDKISFPSYCGPNVPIFGSADFNASATITGEDMIINDIIVKPPLCADVINGSINIIMKPSTLNVYTFSLNGRNDTNAPMFEGLGAGVYTIRIKNQFGCYIDSVVDLPFLNADCKDSLYVPTGFTPGTDGLNDTFGPESFIPVTDFEMLIYNRYGQLVFKSLSVTNKWNGFFRSVRQPSGVYAWQIRYKNYQGKQVLRKGIVTLIR